MNIPNLPISQSIIGSKTQLQLEVEIEINNVKIKK